MEEKLAVPAAPALPESEAATIAATSIVGDEKSDVEAAPPADTAAAGEPEKTAELARQATAASKSGQSIRPTATREDGTEYPSGMKLGLITLALCLSVFLMALGMWPHRTDGLAANTARQLHHRNRHPRDHKRVYKSAGRWMVWKR
jgi:hypothetical protein